MDLLDWARSCLEAVPDLVEDPPRCELSRKTLPVPVDCSTAGLVVLRGTHGYNGHHFVDAVSWQGTKEVLGSLGLIIAAAAFHDGWDDIRIELTAPESEVREIRVDRSDLRVDSTYGAIRVSPESFKYWPKQRECHPFLRHLMLQSFELPRLRLSNSDDMVATEADLASRDVLWGFGHLAGSIRFAELLLDLSRPSSDLDEVQLESEIGFRGVGPASPEVSIWLPGSVGWDEDMLKA